MISLNDVQQMSAYCCKFKYRRSMNYNSVCANFQILIPNDDLCPQCCSCLFPFSSVNDIEFSLLGNAVSSCNTVYDNGDYFSPSQLSNLALKKENNTFFVLHLNTRSLPKKHDKVEELLCELKIKPEVICISETKLNPQNSSNVNISEYNFIHGDSLTNAGGVGLYIKNTLKYNLRSDLNLSLSSCEDMWIEITGKSKKQNIIVSNIYRHPNADIAIFQKKLCETLIKLENSKSQYIITGDININLLKSNCKKINDYKDMLSSVGCNSLISSPSRFFTNCTPSLLDHVYTNLSNRSKTSGLCLFDISDHLPTFFIAKNIEASTYTKSIFKKRSMKTFNLEDFLTDLLKHLQNVESVTSTVTVNEMATSLSSAFDIILNKHAPLRTMTRREKRLSEKPWISKGILKSIKTKNKLFRTHYHSNDVDKKIVYKKYLNKLTHIKYIAKRLYYENLVRESHGNSHKTWSIIGEIINYKNNSKLKIPPTIEIGNQIHKTDSENFLNKLNEHFANIGAKMSKIITNRQKSDSELTIYSKSCTQSFVMHEIIEEEVIDCINNIKSHSAPGLDGISPKFVKMAKTIVAPYLTKLFNKCINEETFPDQFKIASVTPIPKKTSLKTINDFRPISLLPMFSKIFEKILVQRMTKFLNKNDVLTSSQFGFRTSSSTELAVTSIYDKLLQNLDENKITCSIYLDLRKAFDSVNHSIILKKLNHYGFRGSILSFFESYLKNRKICTKLDGKVSTLCDVSYGVPQGSVLGPLLFLLYVNDLPNVSKFKTTLFADDTNLHLSHSNSKYLQQQVSQEIVKIDEWMRKNKLTLNYEKSNFMIIGNKLSKTNGFKLVINKHVIPQTNSVKYLGVILDNNLSWQPHIESISKKLSKACGIIYKLRHYVPLSTLKLIYYSMFNSILQYSLLNWGRAANCHLQKIKVLQNRFLRASLFRHRRSSSNALYSEFGVLKLDDMITMEYAKFLYRFSNNMLPEYFNNYFTDLKLVHQHNTRQSNKKNFYHTYARTEWGRKMVQRRGLHVWKNIPLELKECSFYRFKKTFKRDILSSYTVEL